MSDSALPGDAEPGLTRPGASDTITLGGVPMALSMATISGEFVRPDNGKAAMSAYIEAATVNSLLTFAGGVIISRTPVKLQADGTATVTIWELPQASISPGDARWRLVMESGNDRYVKEFELSGDITWDDIVDVSGVPMTSSLVSDAEEARDAAVAAAASVVDQGPAPSGDTTGATDTTNLVAALAAMGKTSGLTTPTTNPLVMELGAGPYYINANAITIGAGQTVRSKARLGTVINCVGGTVGQAFITTVDTGFTLLGGQLTSHGGEVSGLILDGMNAGRGTIGVLRGSLINAKLDVMLRHFGANTSASAAATTTTVNGRSDTTVVTSDSSIITDVSVAIADLGTAVSGTGIPSGSVVSSLVKGVKFNLGRQAPSPANATGSGSITLQVGWYRNDTVTLTSGSNFVPDASAVAGDLNAPVFGTNVPKDAIVMAVDPGVGLYLGVPARAILYQSQGSGWFERSDDRIEVFNCAMGVVFDGAVTNNSYSYNKLHLTCDMRHDQKLVHVRGNPAMFGQDWTVYGTFTSYGTNNNGIGLMQSGSSGWRGRMEWHVESANHGTQQAISHFLADSPSTFYGVGSFEFVANPGFPAWQSSKRQIADLNANSPSAIGFKGMVGGVWGITDIIGFGAGASRTIGVDTKSNGLTNLASTTYSLFLETGSVFAVTLGGAGTAYTVAFNAVSFLGSQQGFDITFIVTQTASGTASTIGTWPASVKWTTGTAPAVSATLSSVTMYRLVSRDGGATWAGAAL